MKCLLDSMLVLTKQDRLCHVVHATSDSFYQSWLRQLNIMQHCKVRQALYLHIYILIYFISNRSSVLETAQRQRHRHISKRGYYLAFRRVFDQISILRQYTTLLVVNLFTGQTTSQISVRNIH